MVSKSPDSDDDYEKKNNQYEVRENKGERIISLHELDPNTLKPTTKDSYKEGSRYIVIGRPGSGKSTLIKWLMYSKKHIFPVGQAFSGSEESNNFFSGFMPSSFVTEGSIDVNDLTPIENFEKRQKFARKYLEPEGAYPWAINVIDDATDSNKFMKTPVFQRLYKLGRHKRMMHILSLQFALDLATNIRGCIDGVFIMFEPSSDIRQKIYKKYGSYIPSFADFNDLMNSLEQYEALYINLSSTNSIEMEDNVFYVKPDINRIPKNWKFGSKEYWDFHYARFNPDYNM